LLIQEVTRENELKNRPLTLYEKVSIMKLTILGNNGPYPAAGGACSGYLLEEGHTKILLDCGNGVLSNLFRFTKFEELDAIILSHLHSDHTSDMMVLKYAVDIKIKRGLIDKAVIVYAPNQPVEEFNRLDIKGVFDLKTINEDLNLSIGDLKLRFGEMKHPYKSFGVSIENGKKRFVFSGDTAWTEKIISLSKDADLIMLDSGLLSKDKTNENVPHLTAMECGEVAKQSGAKKLLLTHFWPDYDLNDILNEARSIYENAELAELLKTYVI
jgi:ribonuclease BN (tRNA processing enzyme)